MNSSLEFVDRLVKCGRFVGEIGDVKDGQTIPTLELLSLFFPQMKSVIHDNTASLMIESDGKKQRSIRIKYDAHGAFEWATSQMCCPDGTLYSVMELYGEILKGLISGSVYFIPTAPPDYAGHEWDYDVEYTVGDFCWFTQFGDYGGNEKPWLQSKETVCLPMSIRYVSHQEKAK